MDEARESADPLVSPRQIALTYDCVVSAHWRGETDTASALDAWFQAHWSDHAPPEPEAPPEGTSVLGDSGAGIRWYARDDVILGYVSRRSDGCYRVPVREPVPSLKASWDILELEAVRQPDTDNLSHHTGRKPLPASLDHRAVSEPHAAEQQVTDSKGRLARESGGTDMVVAVHVLETTTAENPPGVAASSADF
jgi:hypothetical protein